MNTFTHQEITYLLCKFKPAIGLTLMKETLSTYLEAESILLGTPTPRRISCKCELGHLKENTERLFFQWYSEYKKTNNG